MGDLKNSWETHPRDTSFKKPENLLREALETPEGHMRA